MEEEEEDEVSPEKLRKVVFMGKEKKGKARSVWIIQFACAWNW